MPSPQPRAVFEAFLRAANRRDVAALAELVHPDYMEVYPQSGEQTHGIENLRAIIEHYPGGFEDKGTDRVIGSEDRWVLTPASHCSSGCGPAARVAALGPNDGELPWQPLRLTGFARSMMTYAII